jgi:hypothetical protein
MYGTFGGFAGYFKAKKSYIDNTTFRLHYRTTFAILVISSLLVTTSQFIGSPIQCIVDGVPTGIMNTYCWIHGTFTIPSQIAGKVGTQVAHPGVAPMHNLNPTIDPNDPYLIKVTKDGDEVRHAWYQWVCFVLFLQALMCYVPHYLWKSWEGGKLSLIIQGMDQPTLADPDTMKDRRTLVVNYFTGHLRTHNSYVGKFIFCEVLNLINILTQIYLMDVFLGGQFTTYGTEVWAVSEQPLENRVDPMSKVFPKVTKCTFHKYGPSGTVENKDGLCVLAQNIINEKIYIFLWFWFIILAIWTSIHILLRLVSVASPYGRLLLLSNRCRANNRNDVSTVVKKCHYGDWFLLTQMAKHIQPAVFHDIMIDLRDRMDQKRAENLDD